MTNDKLAGASGENGHLASIHDRVIFRQPGLNERVQYDKFPRKSLLDHFFDDDASRAESRMERPVAAAAAH